DPEPEGAEGGDREQPAPRGGRHSGRTERLRGRSQGGGGQAHQGRAGREAQEGQEIVMTLDIVNGENEKVGSLDLRDEVFGGRVKTDLIHESVVRANAAERRGTHATKNRALVSGSGKKPWRQKGTGRARAGEVRNPLWRKGGTVFGPQPRSYDYKVPLKVEKGALRAAITQKLRDGAVTVVDALTVGEIKTKAAAEMLRRLGIDGKAL